MGLRRTGEALNLVFHRRVEGIAAQKQFLRRALHCSYQSVNVKTCLPDETKNVDQSNCVGYRAKAICHRQTLVVERLANRLKSLFVRYEFVSNSGVLAQARAEKHRAHTKLKNLPAINQMRLVQSTLVLTFFLLRCEMEPLGLSLVRDIRARAIKLFRPDIEPLNAPLSITW